MQKHNTGGCTNVQIIKQVLIFLGNMLPIQPKVKTPI
jgi:hypothetical protein